MVARIRVGGVRSRNADGGLERICAFLRGNRGYARTREQDTTSQTNARDEDGCAGRIRWIYGGGLKTAREHDAVGSVGARACRVAKDGMTRRTVK